MHSTFITYIGNCLIEPCEPNGRGYTNHQRRNPYLTHRMRRGVVSMKNETQGGSFHSNLLTIICVGKEIKRR